VFERLTFTLGGIQRVEGRFRRVSGLKRTSPQLMEHLTAEMAELHEAVQSGDKKEIQCEVADILILASEIANAEGFSLRRAVQGKLHRNADKYPPRALRTLQKQRGMTPQEAMDFAKNRWDRNKDQQYMRR